MTHQVPLDIPDDLYALIEAAAEREYRSVDGQIMWVLASQNWQPNPRPISARMRPSGTSAAARHFREALHKLHLDAGAPSSRTIAAGTGSMSHTTVNEAFRGSALPSWQVTEAIVTQLGGDVGSFQKIWLAAARGSLEVPLGEEDLAQ